jgi:hypothetical protein
MQGRRKLVWGICVSVAAACTFILFAPRAAFNQSVPNAAIVGTWNLTGTVPGTDDAVFLAVMTFNAGGTTVEFDTGGTNSSASPGESISLGKWNETGLLTFEFEQENVTYDGSGNLNAIAIGKEEVTVDPSLRTLRGSGSVNFYACSLTLCPGQLIAGPSPVEFTGRRF